MKKIKILLLSLSILLAFNSFSANLDVKYTNMMVIGSNLVFDIEMKTDDPSTFLAGLDFYINYNTDAFGVSIASNVTVTQIGFLVGAGYNPTPAANSTPSRLGINTFKFFPPFVNVPTTYSKVFNVSIPIIDETELAGIFFECPDMQGLQGYFTGSGGGAYLNYDPVNCVNDLQTLPLNPNLSLIFSEIGDPSNSSTNFVEIYNPGAEVDFTNNYPYYLSIDGSSSIQLTGTLAAGATYTIAYDDTDFTPDLENTGVGTGGTTTYLLTIYGDYAGGTAIDVYDASVSGFNFTGKHAVRHYDIIAPNTTFTAGEWVVSDAANTDMTAGSHRGTVTWNGSVDNDWRTKANWTSFIPDAAHNASVPTAGAVPVIGNGDNAYANDLTITGSLIIESDETNGDGSLITYGTVTGSATVQRFLGSDRFWYVSQPVTAATANVFLHTWLFTYNETNSAWDPFIEDPVTPLSPMKGYAVWTSSVNKYDQDLPPLGDTTTAFDGTLHTGAVSTALTFNGDGWNFVGNPYPSAADWDAAGWTRTGLATNTFYVYDGSTYASYIVGGPGANGGNQYIPAGQGFFVQTSAAGTLGVTDAVRTHNAQAFWKSEDNMLNLLSLTISNGEVNDETMIRFNENATKELDYSYDAGKLMAEASPQAYTIMGDKKMSINTLNNTTESPAVTLGVNLPAEGQYTISASNIESFDASTPIYLEDLLTGQKVSLREVSTYSFSGQEGLAERFVVHFAEYQGIGDQLAQDVNSIYALNKTVYVDFSGVKGEIVIYDILGQEIVRSAASNGMNTIGVQQGNAVYIVKVISDNNTVTKKVFVN